MESQSLVPKIFESLKKKTIPKKQFAHLADSPLARRKAEELIFKSLIKETDGWFSIHLNRPISIRISKLLVPYPIHPNAVTLFTFLVGILSGVFSTLGTYFGFALGGILYQWGSILDGVDGELARVKFLGSRSGQWMDTICDDLTNAIYLGGVTIGTYRALENDLLLWLGVAAVILDLVAISVMYWMLVFRYRSGTLLGFEWEFMRAEKRQNRMSRLLLALEPFMKRDCYAFLFMLFALAGFAWLVIPTSVVGIFVTFVVLMVQIFSNLFSNHPQKGNSKTVITR